MTTASSAPASRFLATVLDGADPSHFLEIRAIGGVLDHPRQWFVPVAIVRRSGLPAAVLALDGKANVYYGAVPRIRPSGKALDCGPALAAWGDFDHGQPVVVLLPPSLLVESSPGRFQSLWLLDAPCPDLAAVEAVNRGIAQGYGADPNACDRARVLRLPGFANMKYRARPAARLLVCEGARRYQLAQLAMAFPPVAAPAIPWPARGAAADAPPWLVMVYDAIIADIAARGLRWQSTGGGVITQCPLHDDQEPSLSLHPVRGWKCFAGCGQGRLTLLAHRLGITLGNRGAA